jgi:hypothetical protein
MSVEKDVREVLGEASAQYKKLDQLVRQGMMSPAALPILHRGLDKMQAGQVLNPQEREAVNKVLQSMLYIVTGDDTVFQKARQHTQRTKYQTESKEEYDNEGEMAKTQLTTLADAAQELMGMLSDDQNLPEWVQSKITKAVDYLDTARDYMKSEGDNGKAPVGEEVMSESYKEKFAAALKKSGKSLAQMSDEEKKKFFNDVDASHKAKNEEAVDEGAMSRMATQASEKERLGANKVKGSGLETYKKKPAAKDTLVASPKTQRVKRTTAAAAKKMVAKGAVYAEEVELLDEGDYAVVSTNGSMITKKSKVHGYVKTMPKGNSLNKLLDKHGADRVIHKDKLKSSNVSEDTVNEEDKTHIVQYHTKDGTHKNDSRVMTKAKAMDHAKRGNTIDKVGGKYTVKAANEETVDEGYDDSEEMRAKTQSKLARMSKMKAKQEKETDPGIKEASAYADARRAMRADSKGMASLKKAGGTKTYKGTKAGEERHGGHIVMQLRKAVSIGKPVKFKDGKEHKVSKADAHKFLSKYNSSKPADREKMHSGHDSHDSFQSHINN